MSSSNPVDSLKAITDMLAATKGTDPLELSPEEAVVAAKLIAKLSTPPDLVRSGLGRLTGDMLNLLLDAACSRDENSETLNLIRQSASTLFQAWIEEEGDEQVGRILGAFHLTFDDRYKGSPDDLVEKGKAAVMWLIEELELAEYLTENPLVPELAYSADEDGDENPF